MLRVVLSLVMLGLALPVARAAEGPAARADVGDPLAVLPAALQRVLREYFGVQQALAADSIAGLATHADAMLEAATQGQGGEILPADFAEKVKVLAAAGDLKAARAAFKPLSKSLIAVMASGKHPRTYAVAEVFCPMVNAGWLQADGKTVANPYHGKAMLTCGGVTRTF